jgi:hypothetical protein
MDEAEIERLRAQNKSRIASRALAACSRENDDTTAELDILLNGQHAKEVALAILDVPAATRDAVRRRVPLWLPFGSEAHLLYELVTDRTIAGVIRVKNLLDAGWNPNLALPGSGRTALMHISTAWNDINRDLVAMLLAAGADADTKSAGGQTALDYAPLAMRNFIHAFQMDMEQDTTNRGVVRKRKSDSQG